MAGRLFPNIVVALQMVYNAVLDAHTSVIAAMKPGVSWPVSGHAALIPLMLHVMEPQGCAPRGARAKFILTHRCPCQSWCWQCMFCIHLRTVTKDSLLFAGHAHVGRAMHSERPQGRRRGHR